MICFAVAHYFVGKIFAVFKVLSLLCAPSDSKIKVYWGGESLPLKQNFGKEQECMAAALKLPVGIEDFREIRCAGFYYIDKTKLIFTPITEKEMCLIGLDK